MDEVRRIEVHKALKEVIALSSTPLLTYAMEREDGRWDVSNRDGAITVKDNPNPMAFASTTVLVIENGVRPEKVAEVESAEDEG